MKKDEELSYAHKILMVSNGQYECTCPPVPTQAWDRQAWIYWIDEHGKWLPPTERSTQNER